MDKSGKKNKYPWTFIQEMRVHTHTHKPYIAVMMDDSAPIPYKRRKLVKTYKIVLTQIQTVVVEVCKETYSKKIM